MSARRWIIVLALPMLCIAGGFLFRPHLPVYSGKTLAEWFDEPEIRSRGVMSDTRGVEAFLELRGEAVPFLTRVAQKGPNWWSRRYAIIYSSFPETVQRLLPAATSDGEYRDRQGRALWLLGTLAYWERQPSRKWGAARPSLPLSRIRSCLRECLKDPSWSVRMNAAEGSAGLGSSAAPLLPELNAMLDENNESLRVAAIKALGEIGPSASNSVPRLGSFLAQAKDHELRVTIETLGRIGPAATPAAPLLVPLLASERMELRRDAALCLANIGGVPDGALPHLRSFTNSAEHSQLFQAACVALWTTAPADEALVAAVSNAVQQDPMMGLSFLHRVSPNLHATNLVPTVRSFTNHAEFQVAHSARQWLQRVETNKFAFSTR